MDICIQLTQLENDEFNRNVKKNDVNIVQTKPQLQNYHYHQMHI